MACAMVKDDLKSRCVHTNVAWRNQPLKSALNSIQLKSQFAQRVFYVVTLIICCCVHP